MMRKSDEISREFGFKIYPFPDESPAEVYHWADLAELLEKLLEFQRNDLISTARRIYVYWGELGTGKTFTCRYFSNKEIQKKILEEFLGGNIPTYFLNISVIAAEPQKTGDLCISVYKNVLIQALQKMTKVNFEKLARLTEGLGLPHIEALHNLSRQILTQRTLVDSKILDIIKKTEEYEYLINLKSKKYGGIGITDAAQILTYLFNSLMETYNRIVVWIDELEKLQRATFTERRLFSEFIRRIYDDIEGGLSIILIFSMSSYDDVEKLLLPPIWSRVGDCIVEFRLISNSSDLIEYFEENVKYAGISDPYSIIEKEVLKEFINEVLAKYQQGVSPRGFNREISSFLSSALAIWRREKRKGKIKIDRELMGKIKEEKELIREVSRKLRGTA